MTHLLVDRAAEILRLNDLGGYTVPTHGLYPFQWNWDSCLTALGQSHLDERRAWQEIDTLFAHQWDDGMVPHIVFHKMDDGYFPGPDVWSTGRDVPTSGITQPAVAGFAVARLFARAQDRDLAKTMALKLLPKVHAWHRWFFDCRDPQKTGLVAVIHPWETGRDNSVDWDEAFERVPTEGVAPFTRRDTQHANPKHRPTEEQYKRYIWLVQRFRSLGWDNSKLHDASPFQIVDPGFNAILLRACADLANLAEQLGETEIARESREWALRGTEAMESLWDEELGQYRCLDRTTGQLVDSASVAGILAAFAPIPTHRAADIARRVELLADQVTFLVPSHDPADQRFDSLRYWRGPVWLIVNYMIADGLAEKGLTEVSDRIMQSSLDLIEKSGFAEYYDPTTGEPCGGTSFSWTAAIVIEMLATTDRLAA